VLQRVLMSMREAANEAGVQIVAGDTKVVQKGKAAWAVHQYSGLGAVLTGVEVGGAQARPGDVVILSAQLAITALRCWVRAASWVLTRKYRATSRR